MTNETTPDAVERQYQDSDGNPCDLVTLCRREPEWAANRIDTLLALYDVTQARLEAFEEQEPDARTCAEWAATVALKSSDVHSAARRYLCGELRGLVAQVHRENDSLRDQLRRTEGARDVATRVAADHFGTICQLRDQLRKVEGEREEALRMVDGLRKSEKTARESMVINMRLRDEAQAENVQLKAELTSLRSLLPDVRVCAEYIVERGVDNADGSARRILAALDSQGGAHLCDLSNDTDHANELVRDAQVILDSDDVAGALERLRLALAPAERAPGRIRGAIEYLERLQKEGT